MTSNHEGNDEVEHLCKKARLETPVDCAFPRPENGVIADKMEAQEYRDADEEELETKEEDFLVKQKQEAIDLSAYTNGCLVNELTAEPSAVLVTTQESLHASPNSQSHNPSEIRISDIPLLLQRCSTSPTLHSFDNVSNAFDVISGVVVELTMHQSALLNNKLIVKPTRAKRIENSVLYLGCLQLPAKFVQLPVTAAAKSLWGVEVFDSDLYFMFGQEEICNWISVGNSPRVETDQRRNASGRFTKCPRKSRQQTNAPQVSLFCRFRYSRDGSLEIQNGCNQSAISPPASTSSPSSSSASSVE